MSAPAVERPTTQPLPGVDDYLAQLRDIRAELDTGFHQLADKAAELLRSTDQH